MGDITQNIYLTFKQAAHEFVNWIQRAQGNFTEPSFSIKGGKILKTSLCGVSFDNL